MSIKLLQVITLLFVILNFFSCHSVGKRSWNSSNLLLPDETSFESLVFPKEITPSQAAEDIEFLIFTLSSAYGGRQYAPGSTFSQTIAALKSISHNLTLSEFHDQIDEALFLIPDNHLKAYFKGTVSKKRQDQIKASQVGSNNIKNPDTIWETRIDRFEKKKILYISIVKFPDSQSKIWNGFITSVSSKMKFADSIVLDLRGNSGGDDTKGMELAQVLFGHPIEHPIEHQYRSQKPETLALLTNQLSIEIINIKQSHKKVPEYLYKDLYDSKQLYKRSVKGQIPTEYIRTNKGTGSRTNPVTGFKKPICILMDKSCGSSCEFTIAAFEWHSYTKKVGENTSGTFHFSNAGTAVLPNSKIKILIPSQYSEYYDRRFIERIGFEPDIRVPHGEDAYTVARKAILAD